MSLRRPFGRPCHVCGKSETTFSQTVPGLWTATTNWLFDVRLDRPLTVSEDVNFCQLVVRPMSVV